MAKTGSQAEQFEDDALDGQDEIEAQEEGQDDDEAGSAGSGGAATSSAPKLPKVRGRRPKVLDLDEVLSPARRASTPLADAMARNATARKVVRDMTLFQDVSAEEFERFYSRLSWRRVPTGGQLLAGGTRSPWVFVLVAGTAKVHHESATGAQVIYSICGTGELLGELSALDGEGHSATVTMLEESLLGALSREEFVDMLLRVPQVSLNLAAITARRLRGATARIQALCRLDVTGRLASQLLLFATHYAQNPKGTAPDLLMERFDPERAALERLEHQDRAVQNQIDKATAIDLHLRQSDLADLIGASRVRVNQALHHLRRSGHIRVAGNRITLLNVPALRELTE